MRVVDLSHLIKDSMQTFPGDPSPKLENLARIEVDGFRTKKIAMCTHTGTHIDAPAHMLADGRTLDQLPCEKFFGLAAVADVRRLKGKEIAIRDIKLTEQKLGKIDFLLLYTGYGDKFGKEEYLRGFPTLSTEAANYLARRGLKGIGIDALSVDSVESEDCPIHKILLSSGLIIIENLRGLGELQRIEEFCLAALPLPISDADGAPARVAAVLEE